MDGTIYLDDQLFDGALEFLEEIRNGGGRYLFLTNNSSKGVEDYVKKLRRLGIPAEKEDFITSVDAMISHLHRYYSQAALEKKLYVMGTASFREQLTEAGFQVVNGKQAMEAEAVVVGFDRELTYEKLEEVCVLLSRGVDYFATNPDWVCPTAWGYVPDCGAMCQMIEHATGRKPYFVGKPQPDMVEMALKKFGYEPEEAVLIGDRLYTDIACGVNGGIDTIFVLSGEGTMEDLAESRVKPTWVMKNIKEIYHEIRL